MPRRKAETYLGKLCPKQHCFEGTELSLLYKSSMGCVVCANEKSQKVNETQKQLSLIQGDRYWGVPCTRDPKHIVEQRSERYTIGGACIICHTLYNKNEESKKTSRLYYQENRQKRNQQSKDWRQANLDKIRFYSAERRARRREALIGNFGESDLRKAWYHKFKKKCAYCQTVLDWFEIEWDHIIPLAFGGEHSLRNLVPSCEKCNRGEGGKFDRNVFEWLASKGLSIPYWLDALTLEDWFILALLAVTKSYNESED